MLLNTKDYFFSLDSINRSSCSGWYIRRDGKPTQLNISSSNLDATVFPDRDRPDVEQAGFGPRACGFEVRFTPPVRNGDEVIFEDADGNEIYRYGVGMPKFERDAINSRLFRMVEPFVEMDIAKVRAALMENELLGKYREMYRESLGVKDGETLRRELVEILADMKATLHLLSAAYIDSTRYKDPAFFNSLPQYSPNVARNFTLDMKGDITGSNWLAPEKGGRWTGPLKYSSIMMPNPGPGEYRLEAEIAAERIPGDFDMLEIEINGKKAVTEKRTSGFPEFASCVFNIEPDGAPFLSLHFSFANASGRSRHMSGHEASAPGVLVKSLEFTRIGD